ncbi:cGMP-gated cation channel alpha-1-like [Pomacea canaliculata]|uniref:cGMP-gated cation channel alpha-1-like n=1 Tax=Pomacea canaliculata TaxID=400727 RepID=UPI000D72E570|nr:cGMP-gated cation channel alpha-1-like [Pomacea canaliculata]
MLGSEARKSAVSDENETELLDKKKITAASCVEETSEMRRKQIDTCWFNIQDVFMDPDSRAAYLWMVVVTVAVIYNWFFVILRIAFEDMREYVTSGTNRFPFLDTLCDIIYFLDVGVQSRTAYLEEGCLVRDLRQTVRHYYNRPHFLLDLMSVLPMPTMVELASQFRLKLHFLLNAEKAGIPICRLLRLLKYHSMFKFFEKTDSRTNSPNILRAFKLSLYMWLVVHWTGCLYYILSQYEGLGTNDWVYPSGPAFASFRRKYLLCMYWSLMTLTTIGERASPVTDIEYIFTGMTFLVGVFVFATVVGNVGDVISNMNSARHDFQAKMDQIKFYLNQRKVPEHLQDSIKRWAEYTWNRNMAIDDPTVLELLPTRLRTEVAIHVHLATLKKVRIFKQCEENLLHELVLKLRPSIYSPGEYICRIGEIGREMYIINHGKVEILLPDPVTDAEKQVAIMTAGNYFGEISLLQLDEGQNKRTADVRSIGFSELLCLSRQDLMSALTDYPEARKILEAQARQRIQQTKRSSLNGVTGQAPSNPDQSSCASENSPSRVVKSLVDVMKSEGFYKLFDGKAAQELTELRILLKELKEVKTYLADATLTQLKRHCTTLEAGLKSKEEELQRLRAQLTNQRISQKGGSGVTSDVSTTSLASPTLSSLSAGIISSPSPRCLRISDTNPRMMERLVVRACGGDSESSGPSTKGKIESASTARALSKPMSTLVKVMPPYASVTPLRPKVSLPDYLNSDSTTKHQKNDNTNKDSGTDVSHMTPESSRTSFLSRRIRTRERDPIIQTSASFTAKAPPIPSRENRDRSSFSFSRLERHHLEGSYPYFLADRGGDAVSFLSHPGAQTSFCSSMGSVVGSRSSFEIVSPALIDKEQAPSFKKKEVEYEEDATKEKPTKAVEEVASKEVKVNTTSSESSTQDTSTSNSTTSSTNTHSGNKPARPRPKYKPLENPGYSSSILMQGNTNDEMLNEAQTDKPSEEADIAENVTLSTAPESALAKGDDTTSSVDVREQEPTILSESEITQSDKVARHEESSSQSGSCTDVLGEKTPDQELPGANAQ